MIRFFSRAAAAVALATILPACSSLAIHTDENPSFRPARLRSYSWVRHRRPAVRQGTPTAFAERILRATIEDELAGKGVRKAPSRGEPEFLVDFSITNDVRLIPSPLSHADRFRVSFWQPALDYSAPNYSEGNLAIDLIDPRTKKVFWHGVATADFDSFGELSEQIDAAVREMLAEFPAQSRPS